MPHSVDFHAAQVAPNVAFSDVAPRQVEDLLVHREHPGVFMYHCGTAPAFVHIANGMYGAIIVEPKNMPAVDKQYVLVSSEWYLNAAGDGAAREARPDEGRADDAGLGHLERLRRRSTRRTR